MTVKELIKLLEKCDPDTQVWTDDDEGFIIPVITVVDGWTVFDAEKENRTGVFEERADLESDMEPGEVLIKAVLIAR